jgi:choline-sulfatase
VKNFAIEADPQDGRPGTALQDLLADPPELRYVLSEYHALHFPHAVFMLNDGRYKYIHYHNDSPELYDLDEDPKENNDLQGQLESSAVETRMREQLLSMLDPEAIDQKAKASQAAIIEANGGVEAIYERGSFNNSPIPGEKADFKVH